MVNVRILDGYWNILADRGVNWNSGELRVLVSIGIVEYCGYRKTGEYWKSEKTDFMPKLHHFSPPLNQLEKQSQELPQSPHLPSVTP